MNVELIKLLYHLKERTSFNTYWLLSCHNIYSLLAKHWQTYNYYIYHYILDIFPLATENSDIISKLQGQCKEILDSTIVYILSHLTHYFLFLSLHMSTSIYIFLFFLLFLLASCFLFTCPPTYQFAILSKSQISGLLYLSILQWVFSKNKGILLRNRVQFLKSGNLTLVSYYHLIHQSLANFISCPNKMLEALRKYNCYRHPVCLHFNRWFSLRGIKYIMTS